MATHVSGQAAAVTATAHPTYLATLRRYVLTIVVGNSLFTDAEQLRTNHAVHECQDDAKLRLWLTNVRRVAAEREAASLARFAAAIERGEELVQQVTAQQLATQPTAQPVAPVAATPAQCDEVYRVACKLSPREKADSLRRLPHLSEAEATAFLTGLHLRRGPRLKYPVTVGRKTILFLVPERHFEGAKVDYGRELGTGPLRPRREILFAGPAERRVWVN